MTDAHLSSVLATSRTGFDGGETPLRAEVAKDISEFLVTIASTRKQDATADQVYGWAQQLNPHNHEAWNGLGRVALERHDDRAALDHFEHALSFKETPAAYINAAESLRRIGNMKSAAFHCYEAIRLDPEFLHAYIELAAIYQQLGSEVSALAAIEKGLTLDPDNDMLRYARACILLARGEYDQGWRDYDSRPPRLDIVRKIGGAAPEWAGEPLESKTLLVIGEQGIGDQLMFARYLVGMRAVNAQSGGIVLFTRPELARLMSQLGCDVVTSDKELDALKVDYWIAMGSLPRLMGALTYGAPYLKPEQSDIARYRALIPNDGKLRVGLCWAGNPEHARDAERSLAFEQLAPILDVPGVTFYSFQYGDAHQQLDKRATSLAVYGHDLADEAAALACMDLIISVDTAALHLAGALGIHAWGLIYTPCDWRWDARQPVPWYPGVRTLHQEQRRDWRDVIAKTETMLREYAHGRTEERHFTAYPEKVPQAPDPVVTKNCRYGPMSFYRNDHYIGRSLELYGEYSFSETSLVRDILKTGDTVIDAGANIGTMTVPMAQFVGPAGRVVAYEPQPRYFALLTRNMAWCDWIRPIQEALGNSTEPLTMKHIPLDVVHAPGWAGTEGEFTVQQARIDDVAYSDVTLIKVDCDGPEMRILEGAELTITRHQPIIYIENDKPAQYPDMVSWLRRHGYRIYQHMAPLFHIDNHAGNSVNVFGSIVSLMLLCCPDHGTLPTSLIAKHHLTELTPGETNVR
ncbi:MAG: hypothetical protein NVS9B4_00730 [Candidatus Acidiferrum sp.]